MGLKTPGNVYFRLRTLSGRTRGVAGEFAVTTYPHSPYFCKLITSESA